MEVGKWVSSTVRYLFRIRNRLALASIFAIVVAIVAAYYQHWDPWSVFIGKRKKSEPALISCQLNTSRAIGFSRAGSAGNGGGHGHAHRARILLRIRRQYDISCKQFIPTLRRKIFETVDISSAVRKIKELRAAGLVAGKPTGAAEDAEHALWEDIKLASFSMLFVSTYMVSALCTLLRVQLHVLARFLAQQPPGTGLTSDEDALDSQMFRALIDGTYRHLFGPGMQWLDGEVRAAVALELCDWQVKTAVQIQYDDLQQRLANIRVRLDQQSRALVQKLFIPDNELAGSEGAEANLFPAPGGLSTAGSGTILKLLYQTWDLLESDAYGVVLHEALDTTTQTALDYLRSQVFFPTDLLLESGEGGRTPPLASLLPQLKAAVATLVPERLDEPTEASTHYKVLGAGPLLDSLCMAVLDAQEG